MNLKGIVVPMITPLTVEKKLDYKGIEKLVEHLIDGGVHGLFILGTTGEGPSLSYKSRIELIKIVCNQVNKRIPVLVGITDASFQESVNISEKSKELGAQAVVLAPPFYFNISQRELYDYTDQLLREITLPVYLYNNPAMTKISFGLEILEELLVREEVQGFKDSSGNMIDFQKLRKLTQKSNGTLLVGPEELLMESMVMGGDGGVPGGANIFPKLYVDIYNAVLDGNLNKAKQLQEEVLELSNVVYSGGNYGSTGIINGIKIALMHMGICNDFMAQPLGKASSDKIEYIKHYIAKKEKVGFGE